MSDFEKTHNASDFDLKKLKRVRFWIEKNKMR